MADADRLAQIDALFEALLDASPEEADRLLADRCDDPEMVRDVLELLACDRRGETPAISFQAARVLGEETGDVDPERRGARVGSYRLIREIGRGGMGVVWLAERADGSFEQHVALKVLPARTLSADARSRFERERQILARLNHDNVARLLDGGVDELGRPFLAMELVEGRPIVEHCDRQRLPLADRVRLVVSAARAVQAAHRNLIVHCDLKPANILVTGEGAVKLLDFGIAELLDGDLKAGEAPADSLRRLTPDYASPESMAGEPVTTASDVYQLGLLLFELTCGRRARSVGAGSREHSWNGPDPPDPPAPSASLFDPGAPPAAEDLAARRRTTPNRLRRALSGDLDSIVAKALARSPEERYASAADLVRDLERWLAGRPVQARDPGWLGRAGKLVRRHPAITALAAVLAVLAVGLAHQTRVAFLETDRAEREARIARSLAAKSQDVSAFLVSMLTDASMEDLRDDLTVVELLDRGRERVRTELPADSAARSELEGILGRVYFSLGRPNESLELLSEAVARQRSLGEPDSRLSGSILHLARAHNSLGHHETTQGLLREALALQERAGARAVASLERAETLTLLSYVHGMLGEVEPMLALRTESLRIRQELFGPNHLATAQGLNDLCFAYKDVGEYDRAAALCRRALEIRRAHGGDALVMSSLNNLARVEVGLGRFDEAERHNGEVLAWVREILPREHPDSVRFHATRGLILANAGRFEEAASLLAEVRDLLLATYPPDHRDFGWLDLLAAQAEMGLGHPAAAETRIRRALTLLRRDHGEDQHLVLQARIVLGETLLAQGRIDEARRELEDAERRLRVGRSDGEIWLRRAREQLQRLGQR